MKRAQIAFMALVSLALAPAASHAARLPDWALELPPAPSSSGDASTRNEQFRVLLFERRITVDEDGTFHVRDRIAKQALTVHSNEVGIDSIYLTADAKVLKSRAWHQAPGKKVVRSKKANQIDMADFSSFLSDRKTRTVAVDGIRAGSKVFFEFESTWKPDSLSIYHGFATSPIVDCSRLLLELPAGWQIRTDWLRAPGVALTRQGTVHSWELKNLVLPQEDALSLPIAARTPVLIVTLQPPPGSVAEVPTLADWNAMAAWYTNSARDKSDVTESVDRMAQQCGSDTDSASLSTLSSCARSVRDRVRYIAKDIGGNGYLPRRADETARQLWGDCKDKATLLQAVLAKNGLTSFPVFVNSLFPRTVSDKLPNLASFNHVVLAVAVPDDVQLPAHFSAATLDDELLGRLVVVDTTDEHTAIGWISAGISTRRALIVAGGKSHLVTLPGGRPSDHRIESRLEVTIDEHAATFSATTRRYGATANRYRARHAASQWEFRRALESTIHNRWVGAQVEGMEVDSEDQDGAFVTKIGWKVPELPSSTEGATLTLFTSARDALASVSLARRQTEVVYGYPRQLDMTVVINEVPERASLPRTKSREGEGWSTSQGCMRDGAAVTCKWHFELHQTRFQPGEFKNLRRLNSAVASIDSATVFLP